MRSGRLSKVTEPTVTGKLAVGLAPVLPDGSSPPPQPAAPHPRVSATDAAASEITSRLRNKPFLTCPPVGRGAACRQEPSGSACETLFPRERFATAPQATWLVPVRSPMAIEGASQLRDSAGFAPAS